MTAEIDLNGAEREVIALRAVWESIDAIVNYEIMNLHHNDPDSEVSFNSMTHQKYFSIGLVDLLSAPKPDAFGFRACALGVTQSICDQPFFEVNQSANRLREAISSFVDWLRVERRFEDVWLSNISLQVDLIMRREEFIKICGDISKHNFARLVRRALSIQDILLRSGKKLSLQDSILAIDNFYAWFHDDIMQYHASTIAEFLNNIRWGIYEYLSPEYSRSVVRDRPQEPELYRYTIPQEISDPVARDCYWEMMNNVSSRPYMPRFVVSKYFKMRY
jgi:hypothetical protein